jgi:hypothetical protein
MVWHRCTARVVLLALLALELLLAAAWTDVTLLGQHVAVVHHAAGTSTQPAADSPCTGVPPDAGLADGADCCGRTACDEGFCAECARLAARSIADRPACTIRLVHALCAGHPVTADVPHPVLRGRLQPSRAPPTSCHRA